MNNPKQGDRISEYVLDNLLVRGSFGQVWKAHHHVWKSEFVAIKVPTDSQFVRNLQTEACTVHGLQHPNIVRAIGLDPYADTPYMVMEYVPGASLQQVIAANPKGVPVGAAQTILRGVLQGLEYAHTNGVIHRDIKPANILIVDGDKKRPEEIRESDVKVTDFGLGQVGQITTASILQSGSLLAEDGKSISGTIAYMAPEQRDGGPTDARSDLYSVGVVLFELICGERPSGSDLPSHVREGLPDWVDKIFSQLYARRDRRFASAADALAALDKTMPKKAQVQAIVDTVPRCPSCHGIVGADDNFCILCGQQMVHDLRRCPKCDGHPAPDDRYCIFCGTTLPQAVGG